MKDRWIILCGMLLALLSSMDGARAAGNGQRFSLTTQLQLGSGEAAQLFVPDYFTAPTNGEVTLVMHLHGSLSTSEDEVYKARANAVLFTIILNGLSSVYQSYFSDPAKFSTITNLVLQTLRSNNIVPAPRVGSLVLTSFSAGYAGAREILKNPGYYQRINGLLLGDSLYSDSNSATKAIQLRDFLQFAIDARDGKKIFLLTHSSVATSGYDSTVQTADYLVSGIGRTWSAVNRLDEIGTQYRGCEAGQFRARGYTGATGSDHLKHLYAMYLMMEELSGFSVPRTPPRFASISKVATQAALKLMGSEGMDYEIQTSSDLEVWRPISILPGGTNGVLFLQPLLATENRFYRARTASITTITDFESYAPGSSVVFQTPALSGSTLGFLDTTAETSSYVTNLFPASSQSGNRVLRATWSFKPAQTGPWLRLTSNNTLNVPNPTIPFVAALRFDIFSTRDLYVTLGLRETETTAAVGANGGTAGGIEWIGGSTQNTTPPLGRFVPAGQWVELVFFIPYEPIRSFVGNGVLNSTTGKGTLEHLALVPADGSGSYTVYVDNLQVIE